jgi:hypothetical protein
MTQNFHLPPHIFGLLVPVCVFVIWLDKISVLKIFRVYGDIKKMH